MTYVVRSARKVSALLAIAVTAMMLMAIPAMAQDTITQADCDAGRITVNGKKLTQEQCEARIGQKVTTASTGFEAWIVGLGGIALMGGAAVVLMRRRPSRNLA